MKSIEQSDGLRRTTNAAYDLPHEELSNAERRRQLYQQRMALNDADAQLLSSEAAQQARLHQIEKTPPKNLTWVQLHELSRVSPELAAEKWCEVKDSALDDLRSGHRAAKATEVMNVN